MKVSIFSRCGRGEWKFGERCVYLHHFRIGPKVAVSVRRTIERRLRVMRSVPFIISVNMPNTTEIIMLIL